MTPDLPIPGGEELPDVGWDEIQHSWLIPDGQAGGLCRSCARVIPICGYCPHCETR